MVAELFVKHNTIPVFLSLIVEGGIAIKVQFAFHRL